VQPATVGSVVSGIRQLNACMHACTLIIIFPYLGLQHIDAHIAERKLKSTRGAIDAHFDGDGCIGADGGRGRHLDDHRSLQANEQGRPVSIWRME
jgi:hypothetical protein